MIFEDVNEKMLLKAGYRRQYNGFTRKLNDGRFHAYINDRVINNQYKQVLDIHFDLFSDNSLHPLVFPMPETLKGEVKRIKNENRTTKSGNMDKKQ